VRTARYSKERKLKLKRKKIQTETLPKIQTETLPVFFLHSPGEALVKRLGADVVIDYLRERFEDQLSGYDCAFDLVGGDTLARLWPVVMSGGRVVSIAGMPERVTARKDLGRGSGLAALFWVASLSTRLRAARHGASYRYLFMHPSAADLAYPA
jgi:alcohol dehydrogenase